MKQRELLQAVSRRADRYLSGFRSATVRRSAVSPGNTNWHWPHKICTTVHVVKQWIQIFCCCGDHGWSYSVVYTMATSAFSFTEIIMRHTWHVSSAEFRLCVIVKAFVRKHCLVWSGLLCGFQNGLNSKRLRKICRKKLGKKQKKESWCTERTFYGKGYCWGTAASWPYDMCFGNHRLPQLLTCSYMCGVHWHKRNKRSGLYRRCLFRSRYICSPSISHFCILQDQMKCCS